MRRLFVVLLFALFLVPLAQSPATLAQSGTEVLTQEEFDDLVAEIVDTEPLFGPFSFELEHDTTQLAFRRLYTHTADFVLTVTLGNPYDAEEHPFDFGVRFRAHGDFLDPTFLQISMDDNGIWWLESGQQSEYRSADATLLDSGRYRDLDTSKRGSNDITIYAVGDIVAIAINGELISSVEAPFDDIGDIMICTGIYDENFQDGAITDLEDVTVWALD